MAELILRPSSDVAKGIEYPAGTHYTELNEEVADDDTTYVQTSHVASSDLSESEDQGEDWYGVEDSSVQGDIAKITVHARMKGNSFSSARYGIGSTLAKSHSVSPRSGSWTDYSKKFATNPDTGNAWTWEEINALQLYLYLESWNGGCHTGTIYCRCTQLYIAVDYTPANEPTVTTDASPTAKDHNSATLGGNVTDDDSRDITERGFEYKEGEEGEILTVSEEDDDFGTGVFSLEITGLSPNTEYYYRAYAVNPAGTGYGDWKTFTTDKTIPTVTVQAVSYILPTTATANGNITSTGGEDCSERGFQYGLTKVATWSVKDDVGGYGAGVFSKGLTDLSANTTYWIRAYAVNSEGTGYSEWLQFQTAAAGIIPTGTLINICSDYSGYTYKLMRSETDDGETYTAYFVISTDLANKQGLAFYKRILDMDLYFNNEDSGTATISVKRDNETSWVSLGSVSLAGDDDIIIKHLAVDVRAKHFLFKISASNHFEFLGVLFQFIPIGMR